jgi:hypothetical protein
VTEGDLHKAAVKALLGQPLVKGVLEVFEIGAVSDRAFKEAQLKQVRVSNRRVERHDLSAADQMSYDAFDQRWFGDIV